MSQDKNQKLRFGMWYDFRNPPAWKRPYDELYGEIFDQIVWGEENGFDDIWLSEHHFIEDGYSPSLMPIAAAIASRTKSIRIGTSVMLLPFHNPSRLGVVAATVLFISGGCFLRGGGVGYKVEEFEVFGVSSKERGARTNEGLEIIRRLWEGETLSFDGKYYTVNNARLTPEPIQQPRPPIWVGGFTPPALRRAAKYADGYIGVGPLKEAYDGYVTALEKIGKPSSGVRLAGGYFWLIPSEDPEKTWDEAAEHVRYQVNAYAEWSAKAGMPLFDHMPDVKALRESGMFQVVDAETCIQMIRDYAAQTPLTHYYSWTLPPGLPASWIQPHLELFAAKVIPAFR